MTERIEHPEPVPRRASAAPVERLRSRERREGAAMLIVLMVLMMTTATATFAIHSTTMEMRSAGYARQALQTAYLSEGAAYAGMAYIDSITPVAAYRQWNQTNVAANTAYVPGAQSFDRQTNLLRIRIEDFGARTDVTGDTIDMGSDPSLGGRTPFQPSFLVDVTDVHDYPLGGAAGEGREQSGHGTMSFLMMNLTSRGTMGLADGSDADTEYDDATLSGDHATMHETVVHSRAMVLAGPVGGLR